VIINDLIPPVSHIIPDLVDGDVKTFTDFYKNFSPTVINNSDDLLKDLRYWPNDMVFAKQMRFWDKAAFHTITGEMEASCLNNASANATG